MNVGDKVKAVITEIKPEGVKISGVEAMLRQLERYFVAEDCQRIKCILQQKGVQESWDELLDVLKRSGYEAFSHYVKQLHSHEFKSFTSELRSMLSKACQKYYLDLACETTSTSAERLESVNNTFPVQEQGKESSGKNRSEGSFTSQSSREWSLDSNDVFESSQNKSPDDGAKMKPAYFRSASSKGSKEKIASHNGSNSSFNSNTGSMENNASISTNNFIKSMPQKLRRRLCEELDHKTGLGKDWSLVAEYLEMEPNVIKKIEEFPEKMSHVLQHMEHSMKNIQDLVDILEKMGRMDCIYIMMEEGVDGISPAQYQRQISTSSIDEGFVCKPQEETRGKFSGEDDLYGGRNGVYPLQEAKSLEDEDANKIFDVPNFERKDDSFLNACSGNTDIDCPQKFGESVKYEGKSEQISDFQSAGAEQNTEEDGKQLDSSREILNQSFAQLILEQETTQSHFSMSEKDFGESVSLEKSKIQDSFIGLISNVPEQVTSGLLSGDKSIIDPPLSNESTEKNYSGESATKCLSYTLTSSSQVDTKPAHTPRNSVFQQSTKASNQDSSKDGLAKKSFDMPINQNDNETFQSDGLVPTPVTPKADMSWIHSDVFRKKLDQGIAENKGEVIDSKDALNSSKSIENTYGDEASTSSLLQEEPKKDCQMFYKRDEDKDESDDTRTDRTTAADSYEVNGNNSLSMPLPFQVEDSLSVSQELLKGSNAELVNANSFTLSLSSALSLISEKMGFGRRPAIGCKSHGKLSSEDGKHGRHVCALPSENSECESKTEADRKYMDNESQSVKELIRKQVTLLRDGRHALVVSNSNYENLSKLPQKNYTNELACELESCGWQVDFELNLSKENQKKAIERFAEKTKNKVSLLFYFGHSVQMHGENFILPVDLQSQAVKTKAQLKRSAISLDYMLSKLSSSLASCAIIDAGRSITAVHDKQGFACVKEAQNQCVLLASSNFSNERFIANMLKKRLEECEAITSIKEWIAPSRNYFEAYASSVRLLPIPVKISYGGWEKRILDYGNSKIKRMAFFSKMNADQKTERLPGKWIVNLNTDGENLESDFSIFLKSVDDESLACYLVYYEGAANGELFLQSDEDKITDEAVALSLILDLLSETVLGPRIVVINSTKGNFNAKDLQLDKLNLQEVLLITSPSSKESNQKFYHEFVDTLERDDKDVESLILNLSEKFNFNVVRNCLFNL